PVALAGGTARRVRAGARRQAGGQGTAGAVGCGGGRRAGAGTTFLERSLAETTAEAQRARLNVMAGSDHSDGKALDDELAGLLEVETFDPPAEFREHALLNDPGVY